MPWITMSEDKGEIILVSTGNEEGILHIGSYLTILDNTNKIHHIVRVTKSYQNTTFRPSPLIIEMNQSGLLADQKCQNIVYATRIIEIPERNDGKCSFIKPQLLARKSNQEEVDWAFNVREGIPVFPATAYGRVCDHLMDEKGNYLRVLIPEDIYYHQTMVTGSTGSGKTVAMKYLLQYFCEKIDSNKGGAVFAINVKEEDLLYLNRPSSTDNQSIIKEWEDLGLSPHGIESYKIYYPGTEYPRYSERVPEDKCFKITINTKNLDPNNIVGLVSNISEIAADHLPAIFRYWKEEVNKGEKILFINFLNYFSDPKKNREFTIKNEQGNIPDNTISIHPSTYENIKRALTRASHFFDIENAIELTADHIIQRKKCSIIDITGKSSIGFGSILLRSVLDKIYDYNNNRSPSERIPVLIIIDEVHEFYGNARSREALDTMDAICRKGRSLKIGTIFSSQNPSDMPKGISNVVNSKFVFKSDSSAFKSLGLSKEGQYFEPESLSAGYAMASIHGQTQLKLLKFPLSLAGV